MPFLLMHTNRDGEVFYFCNLGLQWPHRPECRLIERTSRDRSEAKPFDTAELAREVLVVAGRPQGWGVVE